MLCVKLVSSMYLSRREREDIQSRCETLYIPIYETFAGLLEAALGDGVVLGLEDEGDGVMKVGGDVRRAVFKLSVDADYDLVVARGWKDRSKSYFFSEAIMVYRQEEAAEGSRCRWWQWPTL